MIAKPNVHEVQVLFQQISMRTCATFFPTRWSCWPLLQPLCNWLRRLPPYKSWLFQKKKEIWKSEVLAVHSSSHCASRCASFHLTFFRETASHIKFSEDRAVWWCQSHCPIPAWHRIGYSPARSCRIILYDLVWGTLYSQPSTAPISLTCWGSTGWM